MHLKSRSTSMMMWLTAWCVSMVFYGTAQAQDDGARAYWKTMEGTNFLSFQYLRFNSDTDAQIYDPSLGIYPNSETDANFFLLSYGRQIDFFGRSAMAGAAIYGGDLDTEFDGDPFDPTSTTRFRQTNSGFGDPSVQLTVNLYGAPTIENFYDMANYEPRFTVDVGGMLAIPIGEYNDDKFVNIGLNRWWGRLSLPMVAYFGSYAPLYRTSFEVTPSVYLFAKNDDFLGDDLENDPLFQLEAHLTHDITRSLVASIDFMFRKGMESEINGDKSGEDLDIKTLGFTLDYLVTDNVGLRVSYHSNFIDDKDLDADMMRIQINYGWNALVENVKMLEHH
jgi:hypothetical protein